MLVVPPMASRTVGLRMIVNLGAALEFKDEATWTEYIGYLVGILNDNCYVAINNAIQECTFDASGESCLVPYDVRFELAPETAGDLRAHVDRMRTEGVRRIAGERQRQMEKWSAEHDDSHNCGELAIVAAQLATVNTFAVFNPEGEDPWGLIAKHPVRLRRLEIAGALIAAEIDRELRRRPKADDAP